MVSATCSICSAVAASPSCQSWPAREGVLPPGRVEPDDAAVVVHDLQPAADVHRRRGEHAAALEQGELRRAAADVHVQDPQAAVVGGLRRPRAVGGEHRLHVVPGGGRHELAAPLGEDAGDGLGVAAAQRLAGEDHDAGVDLLRTDPGLAVRAVDDRAERLGVDPLGAGVRREGHGGAVHGVAADDDVAAGQLLADAAQVQPGEHDLGAGAPDVHADAVQGDVVLLPDRVVLEREVGVVVVVVVVGRERRVHRLRLGRARGRSRARPARSSAGRGVVVRGVRHGDSSNDDVRPAGEGRTARRGGTAVGSGGRLGRQAAPAPARTRSSICGSRPCLARASWNVSRT